ncbi:hypothetical protein OIU76_010126 [Salix suchowensis]|nr:hypothetical protein OIU76_010126 [Salix suchowensis]
MQRPHKFLILLNSFKNKKPKIEVNDESQEECNNVLDSNSMEKPSLLEAVLMETAAVDGGDDDGSKTPTSLDHRISITKCPPAPRKPKPFLSRKRKESPPPAPTSLQLESITGDRGAIS